MIGDYDTISFKSGVCNFGIKPSFIEQIFNDIQVCIFTYSKYTFEKSIEKGFNIIQNSIFFSKKEIVRGQVQQEMSNLQISLC